MFNHKIHNITYNTHSPIHTRTRTHRFTHAQPNYTWSELSCWHNTIVIIHKWPSAMKYGTSMPQYTYAYNIRYLLAEFQLYLVHHTAQSTYMLATRWNSNANIVVPLDFPYVKCIRYCFILTQTLTLCFRHEVSFCGLY